ncbi:MAG TPA: hypothetical protein VI094_23325 [Propionibacteriaceae bacterium]
MQTAPPVLLSHLLPWPHVATYGDEQVVLAVDRMGLSTYASPPDPTLEDRELLPARDVLDRCLW